MIVIVVPVVIGALEMVPKGLENRLEKLKNQSYPKLSIAKIS